MKPWAIAGILLVALAVPILIRSADLSPSREASTVLIQLSADLDRYAAAHEWRYPASLEELTSTGYSRSAANLRDPWGLPFVYERHPDDPTRCRAFTLGADARPGERAGEDDVVLYKIRGRTLWKQALGDVPREWAAMGP